MKKGYLLALALFLVLVSAVSAGGKQEGKGIVLRIASSSEGPEHIAIYDTMIADFEAKHPA
jgi:ABC-type glycerol-3-phosphate transport system substrate-binding protein